MHSATLPPLSSAVPLADGRTAWLRPLRPDDAPRLLALCQRLSPESRRRRFLSASVGCTPAMAERLSAVDQVHRVAIAVAADPVPDAPIVGVARFHADDAATAELALVLEDRYQRLGLGRVLLNRLIVEATRRRVRTLAGDVLYDNLPMLRLLRTSGFPLETHWSGGDVVSVALHIAHPA